MGGMVDGANVVLLAASARRGRSGATNDCQWRVALQVDTFPDSMRRVRLQLLAVPSPTGKLASYAARMHIGRDRY